MLLYIIHKHSSSEIPVYSILSSSFKAIEPDGALKLPTFVFPHT